MKIYSVPPSNVLMVDRQRKVMNRKKLNDMKASLQEHGQLQPGVCYHDENNNPHLIAGGRRLTACLELGIEFQYVLRDDLDEVQRYECELVENIFREDLTWQEEYEAKLKLHELRQQQKGTPQVGRKGGHSVADSAEEWRTSAGGMSADLEVAMFAREIPEVREAPNKTAAKAVVARIKDALAREDELDAAIEKAQQQEKAKVSQLTTEETEETKESRSKKELRKDVVKERILEYAERAQCSKFEELYPQLRKQDFSPSVVIWDPPWGVDFESVANKSAKSKSYSDSVDVFMETFPKYCEMLYELMAEDSHLYCFFGIINHSFVYDSLEKAGFETNRMPLIWYKRNSRRTRNPKIWPGRAYEPIAYARKGKKDLQIPGDPDVIETDMPTPKLKQEHPSAKHPDIYIRLLRKSCRPGDKVFDPMSGSNMFGVACEFLRKELQLDWKTCEMDEDFHNLGIYNLNLGYITILTVRGTEREEEPKVDYKDTIPGSPEWSKCWKAADEEKQKEMLEWRQQQKEE